MIKSIRLAQVGDLHEVICDFRGGMWVTHIIAVLYVFGDQPTDYVQMSDGDRWTHMQLDRHMFKVGSNWHFWSAAHKRLKGQ